MSYSFSVSAANAEDAKTELANQFDAVVAQQPIHSVDRDAAQAAVESMIDLVSPPSSAAPSPGQQLHVTVYGSVSSRPATQDADAFTNGVSLNVSISIA